MHAVLRADHVSHLEGSIPYVWQVTPYESVTKTAEGGRDLAYQGMNFVAPDSSARLLDTTINIAEESQLLFLLLTGLAPPLEDTINWIQLIYTADRTGTYVASASEVLVLSTVPEGDPPFLAIWRHLLCRYPGAYTPKTSTFAPLGPDYSYFSSIGRVLKRRDIDAGKEGGYGNQYIKNSSLGYQTRVGID